jgi:hypothetical protein
MQNTATATPPKIRSVDRRLLLAALITGALPRD